MTTTTTSNKQIYVNLPVKDLPRSMAFFKSLGYGFNADFTNDSGACMVISDGHIYAMLLTEAFFQSFIKKPVADATKSTEVLVCLACESRAEVDSLVAKALAAGGKTPNAPQDMGFMYSHGFEDLDGHIWELVHMSAATPAA